MTELQSLTTEGRSTKYLRTILRFDSEFYKFKMEGVAQRWTKCTQLSCAKVTRDTMMMMEMVMTMVVKVMMCPQVSKEATCSKHAKKQVFWKKAMPCPQCDQVYLFYLQGVFFNWASPENVSRLAPPINPTTGPPSKHSMYKNH